MRYPERYALKDMVSSGLVADQQNTPCGPEEVAVLLDLLDQTHFSEHKTMHDLGC